MSFFQNCARATLVRVSCEGEGESDGSRLKVAQAKERVNLQRHQDLLEVIYCILIYNYHKRHLFFFKGANVDCTPPSTLNPPCAERKARGAHLQSFRCCGTYCDQARALNTHTQSIAGGRHDKGDKILSGSHPRPLIKSSSTLCHTEM